MLAAAALCSASIFLVSIGYAIGWAAGYRDAWLAMVPKRKKGWEKVN